jgi:osmotically-inducible protein OsmY
MSFKMINTIFLLSKKQFFLFFLSLVVLSTLLKGCAPAAITAGIAGVTASESEKGLGTTINDTIIHASITETMFKEDVNKYIGIKIRVDDGVVLLTGKVDSPETRINATRVAWKPRGVVEVINEIQITQKSSIKDKAKDLAASTKIRGNLVADKNIKSVNFNVDVVNGIAYLSGVARSEKEMNLVLAYTKETQYINQLVNYIQLSEALSQ